MTTMRTGLQNNGSVAEEKNVGSGQEALREILAQKQKELEEIESKITIFKANLRMFKVEAFRKLANPATAKNTLAVDLHKQEIVIKTKLAQIRVKLALEKQKIENQQKAYLAELNQISSQNAAKQASLQLLKQKVAEVLRVEIDKLRAEALREKNIGKVSAATDFSELSSVKKFNRQFKGFAHIDDKGRFRLQESLKQNFSELPLEVVQEQVGGLLKQSNSTKLIGQSDALKKLVVELDKLAAQQDYRALTGSQVSEQPFMNGDVNFAWNGPARKLQVDVSSAVVSEQLAQLPAKHFAQSGIENLKAEVAATNETLKVFEAQNLEFEKQQRLAVQLDQLLGVNDEVASVFDNRNEMTVLNQTKSKVIEQLNQLNEGVLLAHHNQGKFNLVEADQVKRVFEDVNKLGQHLVEMGKAKQLADLSEKDKKLFTKGGMDLHVAAARSSYQLLDTVQKIKLAYNGEALPLVLSNQLAQAFQKQANLVQTLVARQEVVAAEEVDQEEKYEDRAEAASNDLFEQFARSNGNKYLVTETQELVSDLNKSLAELPVEDIQASRFCSLMMDTLRNDSYWNNQLLFSSTRKNTKLPTGIKEMKNLMDQFYTDHGAGWVFNPVLAKQFLGSIKEEAEKRLNHKVLCFFNPGRDVHTSQFYQFLAKLDTNHITSENFVSAKKVHSIESSIAAKNEERAQHQTLVI